MKSECCGAAVSFYDSTLICKACYKEQPLEVLFQLDPDIIVQH